MPRITTLFFTAALAINPQVLWADKSEIAQGYPDVRIERITRYVPEMIHLTREFQAGDVVVFDLDNTVFREVQDLGTDEWFSYILHEMTTAGLTRDEIMQTLTPLNGAIKYKTRMRLMENEVTEFIDGLQKRGVITLALTARHPSYADSTVRHLAGFNIDFRRSSFAAETLANFTVPRSPRKFRYMNGVMFCGGAKKGLVLKHILLQSGHIPRRLAAIDDRIDHIESYVETTQDLGFQGVLIHYLRILEETPFEPEIARVQLMVFNKLGLILSNERAQEFHENNPNFSQEDYNWSCSRLLNPET